MAVIRWGKEMMSAFGAPFLWLVSLIYFTQGFRSFVWTAVSYQMKDILKLTPSASQFAVSIAYFPWSIKPLYGILSDSIRIGGKKRIPWLVVATVLSLFPWLALGMMASLRNSHNALTVFLLLQNLGSAMADVVIDAMIAEAARSDRAILSGDLQSLSWSAMALGGIFGSLLGGYTLSNLRIDSIFLLFSALPAIQLLSCAFVKEVCSGFANIPHENGNSHHDPNNELIHRSNYTENGQVGSSRRRKNENRSKESEVASVISDVTERHAWKTSRGLASLKSAIYNLCRTFKQPIILCPMAWFFLSHIIVPNLSTVMFYYQTDILHLEASFLGKARVVGWFGLLVGTFAYNRYLKHMRLRRILMCTHIGLATITLLDVFLVSRLNIHFGIPDRYVVLFGSAMGDAVNQFKMMPFLIMSAQLCPPGIEGTLFSLFMSINNLGSTISSFLGAAVASTLNISSASYDNLTLGILIQLFSYFIPIAFLFLIPKGATSLIS